MNGARLFAGLIGGGIECDDLFTTVSTILGAAIVSIGTILFTVASVFCSDALDVVGTLVENVTSKFSSVPSFSSCTESILGG